MTTDTCPWDLFNEEEGYYIDDKLLFVGKLTALSFWFLLAFCYPTLKDNLSYLNMAFFFMFAWIRRATPIVMSVFIDDRQDMPMCGTLGFLETFLAIYEVESLTHICIERYVVAKYITKGWPIVKKHYTMYRQLSLMFAAIYSLPILACGGYGLDFTCVGCTMNMLLPEGIVKYLVTAVFVLRSIKPVLFMIIMLIWAKRLETSFADTAENRMQKQITQDVTLMTVVNLICWTPIALIRGWVVLSQLMYGSGVFTLPEPYIVKAAMLLHWTSLFNTIIIMSLWSPTIQDATLNFGFHDVLDAATGLFRAQKLDKKE